MAKYIVGDVEVAQTLVHNDSSSAAGLAATNAWIDAFAINESRSNGDAEHIGLWAIGGEANNNQFVGVRGVFVAPAAKVQGRPDKAEGASMHLNGTIYSKRRLVCASRCLDLQASLDPRHHPKLSRRGAKLPKTFDRSITEKLQTLSMRRAQHFTGATTIGQTARRYATYQRQFFSENCPKR